MWGYVVSAWGENVVNVQNSLRREETKMEAVFSWFGFYCLRKKRRVLAAIMFLEERRRFRSGVDVRCG